MTYWVHIEADGRPWYEAREFDPPAPKPVPARGFPVYFVEVDGFTFRFSSLAELELCIATLSRKLLPSRLTLSDRRGFGHLPNNHWINRLPKETKTWRYRQKAVKYLNKALEEFRRQAA